jgi:hypothetical protein
MYLLDEQLIPRPGFVRPNSRGTMASPKGVVYMGRVQGEILLKETGAGIPNLLIAAFDVDPETHPADLAAVFGPKNAGKGKLGFRRLGSVPTGQQGQFVLDYAEGAPAAPPAGRPGWAAGVNLMLAVLSPEDASRKPVQTVLYVTPTPRLDAAPLESYLIELTADIVQRAALTASGRPVNSPVLGPIRDLVIAVQKAADTQAANPGKPDRPFSQRYREDLKRRQARAQAAGLRSRPPQGFDFGMPVGFAGGKPPAGVTLDQDQITGQLLLRKEGQAQPIPLKFAGVVAVDATTTGTVDTNSPAGSEPFLVVDAGAGEIRIVTLTSPNRLTRLNSQDSELYRWYLRVRSDGGPAGPRA